MKRNEFILFFISMTLFLIASLYVILTIVHGQAEENWPYIDRISHTTTTIEGHTLTTEPEATYYIRATLIVQDDMYIILEHQIDSNGNWFIELPCDAEYVIIQIVNKKYTFIPSEYRVYDIRSFSKLELQ